MASKLTYTLDPAHSSASFSIKHMMISKVRGTFDKLAGTLVINPGNIEDSLVEATVDAASVNTRDAKRDEHLRSPDFFDVQNCPTFTFKSTKVAKAGADQLQVTGQLTMHGITKEITLDVETAGHEVKDPWGMLRLGASATVRVKRKDFGLTWNAALEAGGVMVGDDVDITLDVEFVRNAT